MIWLITLPEDVIIFDVTNTAHLVFDNDDGEVYFKLYLLLYADDTVVLAESKEQL